MTLQHVAVIGGRGWLGHAVVRAVRTRGLALTVVSRAPAPGVVAVDPDDRESLARALARADVVVNAAGYRGPDAEAAVAANFGLADRLASLALDEGWRLVHVGSAAEYGIGSVELGAVDDRIREDRPCTPTSLYGTTKLAGSQAVLRAWAGGADAAVARVFNLAAADLPKDNPLSDLVAQVRAAAAVRSPAAGAGAGPALAGRPGAYVVDIGDPTTVRDVSRRSWAGAAIVALALADRSTDYPVVNVCSGRGVGMGEMAEALAGHLGAQVVVRDLGWARGGHVVGDPTLLRSLVELPPTNTPDDLVRSILGPAPSTPVSRPSEDRSRFPTSAASPRQGRAVVPALGAWGVGSLEPRLRPSAGPRPGRTR